MSPLIRYVDTEGLFAVVPGIQAGGCLGVQSQNILDGALGAKH